MIKLASNFTEKIDILSELNNNLTWVMATSPSLLFCFWSPIHLSNNYATHN